jgi:hypothetical protein
MPKSTVILSKSLLLVLMDISFTSVAQSLMLAPLNDRHDESKLNFERLFLNPG